jgi:hypothetical protein
MPHIKNVSHEDTKNFYITNPQIDFARLKKRWAEQMQVLQANKSNG